MSHQSEDRIEESAPPAESDPHSAKILPFERPQSDLQRAVQMRAQEALEMDRDRKREANKPAPLRWLIIFLIALIPVVLMFAGVDAFLRVFQKINASYSAPAVEQAEPAPDLTQSEPGVVMLQPYEERDSPPRE
jgi:hypothetical protein